MNFPSIAPTASGTAVADGYAAGSRSRVGAGLRAPRLPSKAAGLHHGALMFILDPTNSSNFRPSLRPTPSASTSPGRSPDDEGPQRRNAATITDLATPAAAPEEAEPLE